MYMANPFLDGSVVDIWVREAKFVDPKLTLPIGASVEDLKDFSNLTILFVEYHVRTYDP